MAGFWCVEVIWDAQDKAYTETATFNETIDFIRKYSGFTEVKIYFVKGEDKKFKLITNEE